MDRGREDLGLVTFLATVQWCLPHFVTTCSSVPLISRAVEWNLLTVASCTQKRGGVLALLHTEGGGLLTLLHMEEGWPPGLLQG